MKTFESDVSCQSHVESLNSEQKKSNYQLLNVYLSLAHTGKLENNQLQFAQFTYFLSECVISGTETVFNLTIIPFFIQVEGSKTIKKMKCSEPFIHSIGSTIKA